MQRLDEIKVASLCSGIGGIDLACQSFGWSLAWHAEVDPHASVVHAARFGDLPNAGDIKTADWSTVEPVDVLTAGYPCQPFSVAGLRRGEEDERHLWPDVRRAIAELRPRLVLLENVRGHVTKGLLSVLGDLSDLGFDAEWGVLGSDSVGGCHRRNRVWIAAADPDGERLERWQRPFLVGGSGQRQADESHCPAVDLLPTPTAWPEWRPSHGDGNAARWNNPERSRELSDFVAAEYRLPPTPTASQGRNATSGRQPDAEFNTGTTLQDVAYSGDFGRYQAAVDRWAIHHAPPPAPTDDRGLNPAFPEWMLGYPAGWVTDLDLSRTAQLRMLGNSVQPQTANAAYRQLIERLFT